MHVFKKKGHEFFRGVERRREDKKQSRGELKCLLRWLNEDPRNKDENKEEGKKARRVRLKIRYPVILLFKSA